MKYLLYIISFLYPLTSCSGQVKNDSSFSSKATVSEISITRFDKDLHNYLQNPSAENQKSFQTKYKDFLPAFGRITINNSDSYKPEFYTKLRQYFSNQMLSKIYTDALEAFEDLSAHEKKLTEVNSLISDQFPGKTLPSLYTHVSGFKENVMVIENVISISIDKYLGIDYPVYKQFFEGYQLIQMQPKMIVRDYLRAWLLSDILADGKKNPHLLDEIIKEGKLLYLLSQLLPDKKAEELIGYSDEQMQWCSENEQRIWKAIVSKNDLYETNYQTINKYIAEAPYTATLNADSPGRVGAWLGWQIVKAYVSKNNTPSEQLIGIDSQQLLKSSGYNP